MSFVVRGGRAEQPRGSYVLEPHDELLILSETDDDLRLRRLFEGALGEPS